MSPAHAGMGPLVGPAPWEQLPYSLFADGQDIYERLHADIGITIDPDKLAAARAAATDHYARQETPAA